MQPRTKKYQSAVSEIVGTIMLLIMAIALFTTVYVFVMNEAMINQESAPSVSLVGTTEGTNTIILENRGGEDLTSTTTIVLFNIAGEPINLTVADFTGWDTNGDGLWNVGEKLIYDKKNIVGLQVEAIVIDPVSDTIIMRGILQEGGIKEYPYVYTIKANDIESDRARLWLEYNFRTNYSGNVRFVYKPKGGSWINTSWSPATSGEGTYNYVITGLIPETEYYYKAQLKYNTKQIEDITKSFSTLGVIIGWYRFDAGVGSTAFDYSGRNNDGTLYEGTLWGPGVNNTGVEFDGIDDHIRVDDHESLDVTQAVSMEAWINPLEHGQGQYGDIKNVIDTSNFGIYNCYEPNMIHVAADVYAVAFRGDSNRGYVTTVSISNSGMINGNPLDILVFYGADCYYPNITHVSGDVYAIAFQGPGDDGYIRTLRIQNNGKIDPIMIDTLEYDTAQGIEPCIAYIGNNIYAIAYTGNKDDGYIATVRIEIDGSLGASTIDKKAFDSVIETNAMGQSREFDIVHLDGEKYAVVYRNRDSDGEVRTVSIDNTGIITCAEQIDGAYVDSYTFDVFDGWTPDVIHIAGEVYGVVYKGFENAGSIRTLTIHDDGTIDKTIIDLYKFDVTYGYNCKIIHLSNDWYAVAYRRYIPASTYQGVIRTFQVRNDGTIDETGNDTYIFESSRCITPNILHVDADVYAISFRGPDEDGMIRTVRISNAGVITKSVIDSAEYCIFDCQDQMIINVKNDVYAMVFRGLDNDGYLRTFKINNAGIVNDTIIDSLEFDYSWAHEPQIIEISPNIFAVVYGGPSWHGWIKTFQITDQGYITPSFVADQSFEFEPVRCIYPDIIHVAADVYAVVYRGPGDDAYVVTLEIASDGSITQSVIDTYKFFGTNNILFPDIIHVHGDIFAIEFTYWSGYDGYVRTIEIQSDGTIIHNVISSTVYDYNLGYRGDLIHVNNTIYAVFFEGSGHDGYVRTIEILNDGTITSPWQGNGYYIDSLRFDSSRGYYPKPIRIQGRAYAFVYMDQWNHGWLRTLRIGENGAITNNLDTSLKFVSSHGYQPNIIHMNGTKYVISFHNSNNDGFVKTINIDYTPKNRRVIAKSGAYQLYANDNTVYGYINSKVLSAPLNPGYNYVVLTYDKTLGSNQMKLYVNTTLKSQLSYTSSISTNNNHIYMGGMHQQIDEVRLWRCALTQTEINQYYAELNP